MATSISRREPVVQPQTGDVLKIRRVVSDHRQVVDQGCGGNHQVRCWNGNALLQQRASHLPELFGTRRIKINHLDLLKEVGDQGQQPLHLRVLVRSRIPFSQG